jgi:hypothetical protein
MKNLIGTSLFAVTLLLFSCSSAKQQGPNTLSKKEIKEGWELLFDGKTMDNWKMFNGGEVTGWTVVDGIMNNSGTGSDHGGDIVTKKQFTNFVLTLEWKIDSASNSGVFYHVQEGITDRIYQSGPEYQLLDDKGWPTRLHDDQYSGANYAMQAPVNAEVVPLDQWNFTKIVVNGPHVEHWLNGKKVVEYELWSDEWKTQKAKGKWKDTPNYGMSKTGHIGLQDHGGLTQFRNIKIKAL